MEFVIKGKEKELKFNIGFIRRMDQIYTVNSNGIEFGMGLNMAMVQLQQYNPAALSDVIRAAIKGNLRSEYVDEALEEYAEENDGLGDLFEQVIDELGKSHTIKATLKRMETLSNQ